MNAADFTIPARHSNARRQYQIWPAEFTPSPGPRRLYGEQPASRIKSILVAYVDEAGTEHTVGLVENIPGDELALIREAAAIAARDFGASRVGGRFDLVSVPMSILRKLNAPVTPEQAREYTRGDNT